MVKNGAQVIHLATGLLVGYPPCPYIHTFKAFLEKRYGVKVVVGTHPIPKKYLDLHTSLGTWEEAEWSRFWSQRWRMKLLERLMTEVKNELCFWPSSLPPLGQILRN